MISGKLALRFSVFALLPEFPLAQSACFVSMYFVLVLVVRPPSFVIWILNFDI